MLTAAILNAAGPLREDLFAVLLEVDVRRHQAHDVDFTEIVRPQVIVAEVCGHIAFANLLRLWAELADIATSEPCSRQRSPRKRA